MSLKPDSLISGFSFVSWSNCMRKFTATFLFIQLLAFCAIAQTTNRPSELDLTLRLKTLRANSLQAENDKEIASYNQEFRNEVKKAIELELDFENDSIPSFGHVKSPDKQFEIYTWNILKEFSEYEYYAFIKFKKGEVIAMGASGGKDSTVLMHVMCTLNEKYNYGLNLHLVSVDEGITGYRDDSLETVKLN